MSPEVLVAAGVPCCRYLVPPLGPLRKYVVAMRWLQVNTQLIYKVINESSAPFLDRGVLVAGCFHVIIKVLLSKVEDLKVVRLCYCVWLLFSEVLDFLSFL